MPFIYYKFDGDSFDLTKTFNMNQHNKTTSTDLELIEKVLNGQKESYEFIIRRYNPYLYKIGRTYGFDHFETEDLMQETYINAYLNLSKFEQKASFKTWIVRIMLNHCYHKKNKSQHQLNEFAPEDVEYKITPMDGNKDIHNNELKAILEEALMSLAEDYRLVFTMREVNGMSTAETAELLGISEANVKVRLNRAKSMLRHELEKAHSVPELFEFNLIYCDGIVNRVMDKIDEIEKNQ